MNFQKTSILLFLWISLGSCSNGNKVATYLRNTTDHGIVLCIPLNGCSGCITEVMKVAKTHIISNPDLHVLLLGDDLKESRFIHENEFKSHHRVQALTIQQVSDYNIDIQFPTYYSIQKGKLIDQVKIQANELMKIESKIVKALEHLKE